MLEHLPIFRSMRTSDWSEYRKRRSQFFMVYLILWPILALVALAVVQLVGNDSLVALIIASGGIAFFFTVTRLDSFICPRCEKLFFRRGFVGNPLTRQCMHCGLAKWAECDTSDRELWFSEDGRCLSCNANMPSDSNACTECGWTFSNTDEG